MRKTSHTLKGRDVPKYLVGKYKDGDITCPCGGDVMVTGEGWYQMPTGFGFKDDGKFHIDTMKSYGWFGICEQCGKLVFAPNGKRKSGSKVLNLQTKRGKQNATIHS